MYVKLVGKPMDQSGQVARRFRPSLWCFVLSGWVIFPSLSLAQECFSAFNCTGGNTVECAGCDDGKSCTFDWCSPISGCKHDQSLACPDDGKQCNGVPGCCDLGETCDPGTLIGECSSEGAAPAIDCTGDPSGELCVEPGVCQECVVDQDCEDFESCTLDTCVGGACERTILTTGSCNDGDPCTLSDACSPQGVCTGIPRNCDDNNDCTDDSCVSGLCTNVPLTGVGCSPLDVCFPIGICDNGFCSPDDTPVGCIDVELRGPSFPVNVGDIVEVELRLIDRCGGFGSEVSAMDVVVGWDPAKFKPADKVVIQEPNPEDPCNDCRICFGGDNAGMSCLGDIDCPPAGIGTCEPGIPLNNCALGESCCDDRQTCNFDCGRTDVYNWGISVYRLDDEVGDDRLNADCGPTTFCTPYTGTPFNDGNLLYVATQQLLCASMAAPSAFVPANSSGLLVTKLKFEAIEATAGLSDGTQFFVENCAGQTRTKILSPGIENTGSLVASNLITVECLDSADCPLGLTCINGACDACLKPIVVVAGPRYVNVSIPDTLVEGAILVEGADPEVSCVSVYASANGRLVQTPTYMPPTGVDGWNTVHVRGAELLAGHSYTIQTDCDPAAPGTTLSEPVSVTMWEWADVDNSGLPVEILDAVHILDAFRSQFHTIDCTSDVDCLEVRPFRSCDLSVGKCLWNTVESVDLFGAVTGCIPDRSVDIPIDVVLAIDAFRGLPSPCPLPCP